MYRIPAEYYQRIHHCRPRFKSDVENVLLYMAQESVKIADGPVEQYSSAFNDAIRLYPGNEGLKIKTINNWRTEISSLFGFYIEDKEIDYTKTGEMAKVLASQQDLIQFFKYFLFSFQYPGGHLKSQEIRALINAGVKFKPAKYIASVLIYGNDRLKDTGKLFSINKAEATHCIFNDLRVTRDNRNPYEVVDLILENRRKKIEYDTDGDVIRYAGDILDYMVLANLLKESHGYYYINGAEAEALSSLMISDTWFDGYDKFYGTNYVDRELTILRPEWYKYVNSNIDPNSFKTNLADFIQEQYSEDAYAEILGDRLKELFDTDDVRTKDIGDLGESLVIGHEKMRVIEAGLQDYIHLIKKIPTALAVGYDIQSLEGTPDRAKRYIEVKSTISRNKLHYFSVHLTPNEWESATTLKEHYFIYRLMITSGEMYLYLLQDPVAKYKADEITMVPRNGAEIGFSADSCERIKLKLWQQR
ncbi:MAG: protein NO VEIN domain-containing protein [Prevotella sp.]